MTGSMTEGKMAKKMFFFALPLIFSNLLQVIFNMSDVAVVGQFSGSAALGAVGSTTTLVALYTSFLIGMSVGVSVMTARFLGAGEDGLVRKTTFTAFLLSLGLGLLLFGVAELLARPLLLLLHTKDELLDGALLYLRIYAAGFPALSVYNFGNATFSASGDTKKPLLFLAVSGAINVALNLFFVAVLKMSVDGVALASVISQYVACVAVVLALIKKGERVPLRFDASLFSPQVAKDLLRLGVPAGLQGVIFHVANLFVQSGLNTFPVTTVEGVAASTNADALVYNVMDAFYASGSAFIGQNHGAGKPERIKKAFYLETAYAFIAAIFLGAGMLLFGKNFLWLFNREPAVIREGYKRLKIMSYSYAVSAFMDGAIAASRGIGKTLVPTVIVVLGSCVFRVAWIYTVFRYFQTIESLYLLYVCSWTITAAFELLYFARSYKILTETFSVKNAGKEKTSP